MTSSDHGLQGTHALVTGAGRGIGKACALALAEEGPSVILVARTEADLQAVASEIELAGGNADVCVGDLTDPAVAELAVHQAARAENLWACVNAAGINRTGPTVEYSLADWEAVMAINVRATFLVCQAFGAELLKRGRPGRIVNLSSQMGSVGFPGRAAYCTSKHAINGLTKALGVEWAPHGVTVNAVAPTFVETPLTAEMLADPEFHAEVLRRIPTGRIGSVEDVTHAVLYLVSAKASLVTGSILAVDGGWVAW